MQHDWDEKRLLSELRTALDSAGPVSDRLLRLAEGAFAWRTVDEDLAFASLVSDSLEDRELVVRGAGTASRVLVFEAGELSVEVEVSGDSLVGQLVPPTAGTVTLEGADGTRTAVTSDELGCFAVTLPDNAIRLTCRTASGSLVTEWVRL